jgi:hypothetical protein
MEKVPIEVEFDFCYQCLFADAPSFVNVEKWGAVHHYGNSSPSCVVILYINNLRIEDSGNP